MTELQKLRALAEKLEDTLNPKHQSRVFASPVYKPKKKYRVYVKYDKQVDMYDVKVCYCHQRVINTYVNLKSFYDACERFLKGEVKYFKDSK